jgi:hypothetical protein
MDYSPLIALRYAGLKYPKLKGFEKRRSPEGRRIFGKKHIFGFEHGGLVHSYLERKAPWAGLAKPTRPPSPINAGTSRLPRGWTNRGSANVISRVNATECLRKTNPTGDLHNAITKFETAVLKYPKRDSFEKKRVQTS